MLIWVLNIMNLLKISIGQKNDTEYFGKFRSVYEEKMRFMTWAIGKNLNNKIQTFFWNVPILVSKGLKISEVKMYIC